MVTLLDQGGNRIERYRYDAFGKPTITDWNGNPRTQSAYGNRFMYTGREWLAELAIYDYRHRMYNPVLGRFLQTDPMGLQTEGAKLTAEQKAVYGAGAPEAFGSSEMNLFRYCGDDPVDGNDPFGLVPPAEGLKDLTRETVQEIKDAMKDNIHRTQTEKSPDGPGGTPRHQEHRTMAYDNNKGERKTSTETGRHDNGIYPYTEKPKNPFNEPARPAWDSHSHISGSGRPYAPEDFNSVKRLGVPSGVQSATGGPLFILVPSATRGGEPGLFRVDGNHLINVETNTIAPH